MVGRVHGLLLLGTRVGGGGGDLAWMPGGGGATPV